MGCRGALSWRRTCPGTVAGAAPTRRVARCTLWASFTPTMAPTSGPFPSPPPIYLIPTHLTALCLTKFVLLYGFIKVSRLDLGSTWCMTCGLAAGGGARRDFLLESLRATQSEVTQHGACLGLGLAGLGTGDEEAFEDLKNVLYTDSAVAGEVGPPCPAPARPPTAPSAHHCAQLSIHVPVPLDAGQPRFNILQRASILGTGRRVLHQQCSSRAVA